MDQKEEIWNGVLGELEISLSRPNFNTWFKDTFIYEFKNNSKKVIIGVPNTFTLEWLQNKYASDIKKALAKFVPEIKEIQFKVCHLEHQQEKKTEKQVIKHLEMPTPKPFTKTKNLNEYFTFENFIVGENNRFAHAAALAITKQPGKTYNPLFIYGGVGLGKTHLIQAIAWEIKKNFPHKKVLYLTFDDFTTDFINYVQNGKMEQFKNKYRYTDALLIDDIQFISGKEKTQDEFFHTFNYLYQNQKQIVLTSDRPPKSIPLLEERLKSRFEWGMIVDITPPDLETRLAILKHKAKEKNLSIPDEILEFVAHNIQNNIRELESSLNKIEAYINLTQKELSINQTKKLLEGLIKSPKNINPEKIIDVICNFYQVNKKELLGRKKERRLALPRQIIMYFLRYELHFSFTKIAEVLKRKDHTTVIYGCEKIEKEININSLLKRDIDNIKQYLETC